MRKKRKSLSGKEGIKPPVKRVRFLINPLSEYKLHYVDASIWKKNIAVALAVRSPWQVQGAAESIKDFPFKQLVKTDDKDGEDDEFELKIHRFSRSVLKARIRHSNSK